MSWGKTFAVAGLLVLTGMSQSAFAITIVPEIDPASITSAMTLLVGSALLLTCKRAK